MDLGMHFSYQEQKSIMDCCVLSDLIYQKDKYIENIYDLSKIKATKNEKYKILDSCLGPQRDFFNVITNLKGKPLLYHQNTLISNKNVDVHFGFFKFYNKIVLSYQGTYDVSEVIADLNIKQIPFYNEEPDVLVHEGFLSCFKTSINIVDNFITKSFDKIKDYEIYITGHSLGAAISSLATLYFTEKYPELNFNCVTFGCPKIGNKNFVNYFDKFVKKNIQFINHEDLVPTLPPLNSYCLLNNRFVINNKHIVKDDTTKRFYHIIFDFFTSLFNSNNNLISMHHCDNYLKDLKNCYLDLFISLDENEEE
jgi:hypothetical protein